MDSWINEYDRLQQLSSDISADIKEYHTQARNGSNTNNVKLSAAIRKNLVQLTTDIARLHDALPNLQITEKERNRRKDMTFNLATRKDQLSELMSKPLDQVTSKTSAAAELKSGAKPQQKRAWGAQGQPQETDETRQLDNGQLLQLQKSQMGQQEEHLDLLSQSLNRQKEIGVTINTELDVHTKLLDDMDTKVHKTQAGIERERRHMEGVSEKSKVCGMWVIIIILMLIIVVLAATDWGCKIYHDSKRCS